MKRVVVMLGVAMMLVACSGRKSTFESGKKTSDATAEQVAEWTATGDEAWGARSDEAKLRNALETWEKALAADPNNLELLTRLCHGYYFLADGYTEDVAMKIELHDKGAKYGERGWYLNSEFKAAVDGGKEVVDAIDLLGDEHIGVMYWTAANMGRYGVAKGLLQNLFLLPTVKKLNGRVMELQEDYFYGGPHRFFGAFYAKAPGFAGGDMEKSVVHFEKALELAPDYFGTRVLYAEFYAAKKGDKQLFTKQLEYVKSKEADVLSDIVPEQTLEKAKAEKLLADKNNLFN